jgi:glutaconate CoA-transferase subunit B
VVTNLGLLEPDDHGELTLTALHPNIEIEQVRDNTGWDLKVALQLQITQPPTREEFRILREDLDPEGIYLK